MHSGKFELFALLFVDVRLEVGAATCLIQSCGSDDDEFLALAEALGVDGGGTAGHTDGRQFRDLIGKRHQVRYRTEGLIRKGGVESGKDDTLAEVNELESEGN